MIVETAHHSFQRASRYLACHLTLWFFVAEGTNLLKLKFKYCAKISPRSVFSFVLLSSVNLEAAVNLCFRYMDRRLSYQRPFAFLQARKLFFSTKCLRSFQEWSACCYTLQPTSLTPLLAARCDSSQRIAIMWSCTTLNWEINDYCNELSNFRFKKVPLCCFHELPTDRYTLQQTSPTPALASVPLFKQGCTKLLSASPK